MRSTGDAQFDHSCVLQAEQGFELARLSAIVPA